MKTQSWLVVAAVIVAVLPLGYLWTIYDSLPATIATHYGLNGPDRFGEKNEIWGIAGLMSGVSLFVFFLVWNVNKIDPKKTAKLSMPVFRKFALLITFFIAALNFLIIRNTLKYSESFERYLPVIMGLFFAVLGNFMHSIKPNYFVGIRTPWTLENELVWKKTHQLGGKLWFVGGILIAVLSLLLPKQGALICMVAGIAVIAIVPVVYSFIEHRKLAKQINQ